MKEETTSEPKDVNCNKEETDKKTFVYHDSQEYLYKQDGKVFLKGQIRKGDDGNPINDYLPDYKEFFNRFFSQFFEHITILSAAGTSMDNGQKNAGKGRPELWDKCEAKLLEIGKKMEHVKLKDNAFWQEKDIEKALSYIDAYQSLNINDISAEENEIKKIIRDNCTLKLDQAAPHEEFLRKITARKINTSRVQLFTTNYDTLWEQAASNAGFTIIDGFSFSHPRKFSGRYFDIDIVNREKTRIKNEDNFIPNVIHLYKLHGSVDWKQDGTEIIQTDEGSDNSMMIYPASNKYENSYKQPYFEMMSRFQQSLRRENILLLVVGFGFQDMHISNILVEAVKQNPSLHIAILDYNKDGAININHFEKMFAGAMSKVTIIFGRFADFTKNLPVNKVYQEDIYEKDL